MTILLSNSIIVRCRLSLGVLFRVFKAFLLNSVPTSFHYLLLLKQILDLIQIELVLVIEANYLGSDLKLLLNILLARLTFLNKLRLSLMVLTNTWFQDRIMSLILQFSSAFL